MVATKAKARKSREERGPVITSEQVFEASVSRLIAEEQQLEQTSTEVLEIKLKTLELIRDMEAVKLTRDEASAADIVHEAEETRRKIRNEIVVLNLRLVTQVLKKYGYFSPDKYQNGCVGLLKAADTYKSETEVPFANYACFCIENEIRLAYGYASRKMEGKKAGYLQSLDAPTSFGDGGDRETDGHSSIADAFSYQVFDGIISEAEVDALFYDIIIPAIDEYGQRAKDIDLEKWRQLELQYIMGLSVEQETKRVTLKSMADALGSTPQNLRIRHNKVMELIRKRCITYGYVLHKGVHGCYVVYNGPSTVVPIKKK